MKNLPCLIATASLLAMTSLHAQSSQSPIDIVTTEASVDQRAPIALHVADRVDLTLINTGAPDENATVRAVVPADAATVEVDGETYRLKQFHFHSSGEHEFDGRIYPLEIHSVFESDAGHLAVIGRLVVEGKDDRAFDTLFANLPQSASQSTHIAGFALSHLFPKRLDYYRYEGSLTTPPYTEGVHWFVLSEELRLAPQQIEQFRVLFPHGDAREVQPVNGRTVVHRGAMTYRHLKF
jgi:carbonic anhydrase